MRPVHLIFVLTGFVLLVCGYFYGHVVATTNLKWQFPFSIAHQASSRVHHVLQNTVSNEDDDDTITKTKDYTSIFVSIEGLRVPVPSSDRDGSGGGMTSIGDILVVQRLDGVMFAIDSDRKVSEIAIEPPKNGFDSYFLSGTQGYLKDYNHHFSFFRFNDVLYLSSEDREKLVVSYTFYDDERRCYATRIADLGVNGISDDVAGFKASANDWRVVFETEPCLPPKDEWRAIEGHMAGGRIASDAYNRIYLASGDYSFDGIYGPASLGDSGVPVAQDFETHYGKVLRIDLDSGEAEIVSRGHRNMQGIAFDRQGQLWTVEHGVRGGDELNLIRDGGNAGWPHVSYGTLYSTLPFPGLETPGFHSRFDLPKVAFLPSIAVSGLTLVEDFHETWDGDLLASTLRGLVLVRFRIVDKNVIFSERIDFGERVRYIHQHSDGQIAVWLGSDEVVILKPKQGGQAWQYVNYRLEVDDLTTTQKESLRIAVSQCSECHSLTVGDNQNAPSLGEVFGKRIGSTSYEGYSAALQSDGRIWTEEHLIAYLNDPESFIPGGAMPNPMLDEDILRPLVSIVRGLSETIEIPQDFR